MRKSPTPNDATRQREGGSRARRAPVERPRRRRRERGRAARSRTRRAHAHALGEPARAAASAGAAAARRSVPSMSSCSTIITTPASCWSVSAESPYAPWYARIERREGEDEHVREDLPGREHRRRERDAAADASAACASPGSTRSVQTSIPHEHPADVLEVVEASDARARRRRVYGMCQIARFAAQSANATRGRSSVPSTARTRALRASGASTAAGRKKTSSGPRSAVTISAGPRSPISTCCAMCAERSLSSAIRSSGPTSAKSVTAEPEREERDAIPAGEIGAPAPAQPHDRLGEERERSRRRQHERLSREPRRSGMCAVTACPSEPRARLP